MQPGARFRPTVNSCGPCFDDFRHPDPLADYSSATAASRRIWDLVVHSS